MKEGVKARCPGGVFELTLPVGGPGQGHSRFETQVVEKKEVVAVLGVEKIDDGLLARGIEDFLNLGGFVDDAGINPSVEEAHP